jgi:membrane protein
MSAWTAGVAERRDRHQPFFLVFTMLAVASSLQQIYEKVFRQDHHRGLGELSRLLSWIAVLCGAVVAESLAERPVSAVAGGGWLAPLVTVGIMTPFFWWTMHVLLAHRVAWRTLLPSAIITGSCTAASASSRGSTSRRRSSPTARPTA